MSLFFFLMIPLPPRSTLFPYTTLFRSGRRELVTSALTLLALLVVPYRSGDHLLAERYEALLTRSRGVHVAEISRDHLRAAADRKSTRLNSSHQIISYAVFCLKKKKTQQ